MLHVGACCKLLDSLRFLKRYKEMEITRHEIRTLRKVAHNLPAVTLQLEFRLAV